MAEEEVKQEEEKQEEDPRSQVAEAFAAFPDAPSQGQIDDWKTQYGEVFCSGFSETELFVWRPISRVEFAEMQQMMAQSEEPVTQFTVEEYVVKNCVLWASGAAQTGLNRKAGSYTTLHEQILSKSNFVDPRVASQMIIKI